MRSSPMFLRSTVTLAVLAGSLLSACTVGPEYHAPEGEIAAPAFHSVEADPDSATRVTNSPVDLANWWTRFNDATLDSLVARAIAGNKDLKVASSRLKEARAARGIVAADLAPSLDGVGNYSRSRNSENTGQPLFNDDSSGRDLYQLGFDARWEIDVFGGTRRGIEAADADIQSAEENRRDVLVTLLAEVARNYIEARSFQARVRLAEENIRVQQETLDLVSVRFKAGLTSELDVAQARAQLETRRATVPPLQSGYRTAAHRLGVLVGLEPGALLTELASATPIPAAPGEIGTGVPSEVLRRRPDIRRAERDIASATARIGVATADLFPKFTLNGSFLLEAANTGDLFDMDSRSWAIAPGVRWNLFDGGKIRSNIGVQDARAEQALLAYERTVLTSLEEAENAITQLVKEQQRWRSLSAAVAANQRSLDLATSLYKTGIRDFLNVLESQRLLFESQDALVQSQRAVSASAISLYKALGGGWEGVDLEVAQK